MLFKEEIKNGVCLDLLVKRGEKTFRCIIQEKYETSHGEELYRKLIALKPNIDKMKRNRKINHEQMKLMLPDTHYVNLDKLDTTCLFVMYRLKVTKSDKFWKVPPPKDKTEAANIARFINNRNKLNHKALSTPKKEFNLLLKELKRNLLALDGTDKESELDNYIGDLDHYFEALDEEIQQQIRERIQREQKEILNKGYKFNLVMPEESFVERLDDMNNLYECISTVAEKNYTAVVLHGLSGVGKSQLATSFCHKYQKIYGNNTIWINGETKATMENDFRKVAEELKIEIFEGKQPIPINVLMSRIYKLFTNDDVLIVFDDVVDIPTLNHFLPPDQQDIHPTLLITSQLSEWGSNFYTLKLDVFTKEIALTFINQELECDTNEKIATEFLEMLSYHPLALQHAISYVKGLDDFSLLDYMQQFRDMSNQKTSLNSKDMIGVTFTLALKQMKEDENFDNAMKLLNLVARIDGTNIRKGLLVELFNDDADEDDALIEMNDALRVLRWYSLAYTPEENLPFCDQKVLVHALVQTVIEEKQREHLQYDDITRQIFHLMFKKAKGEWKSSYYTDAGKYWYEHFQYIFYKRGMELLLVKDIEKEEFNFLFKILMRYHKYDFIIDVTSEWIEYTRNKRFKLLFHLLQAQAQVFDEKKEYSKAIKRLYEIVYTFPELMNSSIGLNIQGKLGACLVSRGDIKEGLGHLEEIYPSILKRLGHDECLIDILIEYAAVLHDYGDSKKAQQIYEEALKRGYANYAIDNKHLLTLQNNYGMFLHHCRRYAEALKIHEKTLKTRESMHLSPDHPDILASKFNIAVCYAELGRYSESSKLSKELKDTFPSNHPQSMKLDANIGRTLMHIGCPQEAFSILKDIESKRLEILPANHEEVLATKRSLAECLHKMGDNKSSIRILEDVVKIGKKQYKSTNLPNDLRMLAHCYSQNGDLISAIQTIEESIRTDDSVDSLATAAKLLLVQWKQDLLMMVKNVLNACQEHDFQC